MITSAPHDSRSGGRLTTEVACTAADARSRTPAREHGPARQQESRVPVLRRTLCRDLPKPDLCGSPLPAWTAQLQARSARIGVVVSGHRRPRSPCEALEGGPTVKGAV